MRAVTFAQGELSVQVRFQVWDSLDVGHEGCINFLLDGFEVGVDDGWWDSASTEELSLVVLGGLGSLEPFLLLVQGSSSGNSSRSINFGAGGNDVGLVNTAARASVDFVWSSDEQQTRRKLLQEDDAFTTVATREEDEDGAFCKGSTEFRGSGGVVADASNFLVIGWVEPCGGSLGTEVADLSLVGFWHDEEQFWDDKKAK